jgi:hypothetical protein
MKTFKELTEAVAEAWPGTPEYNKKFGKPGSSMGGGNRHEISTSGGVTRATRKYDPKTGESEDAAKDQATGGEPVKRGRGRPPGQYGSYKKKVQEALDHINTLSTEEEIEAFVESLDQETLSGLLEAVDAESEQLVEDLEESVEQIEEAIDAKDYHVTSEKSVMTGGHRPKVVHKTKGTTMHLGQHSYKSPEDAKAHAQVYLDTYAKKGSDAASSAAHDFASKNKDKHVVKEGAYKYKKEEMDENIVDPDQHKLDKNKNGKLDKDDFKILRGEKKHEVKESEFKIGDQVIAESWFGIKRGIVANIDANGKVYVKHNDAKSGTGVYNGSYDPSQIKKR